MNETPDDPGNGEDNSEFEDEIASLTTLISQARESVAGGNTVDLTGLSEKVSLFHPSVPAPSGDAGADPGRIGGGRHRDPGTEGWKKPLVGFR